jgi:hypothetical protein
MSTSPAPSLARTAPDLGRGWCLVPALPRSVRRSRRRAVLAEPRAAYEPSPPATRSASAAGPVPTEPDAPVGTAVTAADAPVAVDAAPFELPVLAELPELANMLQALTVADRAMSQALVLLARLLDGDEVVTVSGVSVEEWIGIVARHTRMDRRFTLRTARLLHRFPTLRGAVESRQLSWPQLRGLALALRDCPTVLDGKVDAFLGDLLPHLADTEPDAVVDQVKRAVGEWAAELAPEVEEGPARNYLHLQPRLDGTGGKLSGELDAVGLAIIDDATAPTRTQLDHPAGIGGARADNLLTRLTHTCDPATPSTADGDHGVEVEAAGQAGTTPNGEEEPGSGEGPDGAPVPSGRPDGSADGPAPGVKLLLRAELADLLDTTRTPIDLLTRLVGGQLRLTAAAARRLLDERGAELRTVVVNHGQVLGVGRTTRVPPGWLRDATLAVHSTCTAPLCDRPALGADLDHARPWHPTRPDDLPGGTDVDNLGPLCATTNRAKEAAGWRATQHPDSRRTWTHPRTGLKITSLPTTWRPPPRDGPSERRDRDGPSERRDRDGPD